MTSVAIACFVAAGLAGSYRVLRGPELADRVAALDLTLVSLMGIISVDAARRDDTTYLALLVVIAIIGFTATVSASRFIENEGARAAEDPS